eukprot:gb/GECH01008142.1/.p1 GENE.gb/GECH01008142.1/~~gb/GECH01008142.1/.p1  ORF type:complete len:725 (+),score=147.83 gb/GECH01008142.1/:1-2175(+)
MSNSTGDYVVGIDFGNQSSVVSVIQADSTALPEVVRNNLSNTLTPSLVSFRDRRRYIGEEALSLAQVNYKNTVRDIPALLSTTTPISVSYQSPKDADGPQTHQFSPPQLAAMLLRLLSSFGVPSTSTSSSPSSSADHDSDNTNNMTYDSSNEGNNRISGQCKGYVISFPVAYTDAERNKLRQACSIAGLDPVVLIPATAAAGLVYAHKHRADIAENENQRRTVVMVDAGHAYTSVAALEVTPDQLELKKETGINWGGRSVDESLVKRYLPEMGKQVGDEHLHENSKAVSKVYRAAEKTKKVLSTINKDTMQIECLANDRDASVTVTRESFEQIMKPMLSDKIHPILDDVITAVGGGSSETVVEGIGGTTRIRLFEQEVCTLVNQADSMSRTLDGNVCVAVGCALFGSQHFELKTEVPYVALKGFNTILAESESEPSEEVKEAYEFEKLMTEQDAEIVAAETARNALERYIYNMRSQCLDGEVSDVLSDKEKEEISKMFSEAEDWVFTAEENTDKTVFEERESNLRSTLETQYPQIPQRLQELDKKRKEEEAAAAAEAAEAAKTAKREPRTDKERIKFASEKKEQGNKLFKEGDLEKAVGRYVRGIQYLSELYDPKDDLKQEGADLKTVCHLNAAACMIKLKLYTKAIDNCSRALEINDSSMKAYFRRGQAYSLSGEYDKAQEDLKTAQEMSPDSKSVKKEMDKLQKRIKQQEAKEKAMYSRMFG